MLVELLKTLQQLTRLNSADGDAAITQQHIIITSSNK